MHGNSRLPPTLSVLFWPQDKVKVVRRVDSVVHVGIVGQQQLLVRQHLGQRVPFRITLQAQLEHRVPDDLGRALVVAQHNTFVQHDSVQLDLVRLEGNFNDVEIGRTLLQRRIVLQLAVDDRHVVAVFRGGRRVAAVVVGPVGLRRPDEAGSV